MTKEQIKEAITGLMVTLGTDTERKFAWCLRKVNGKDMIYLHEHRNGLTHFNEKDFITAFPVETILECLKL